MRPWTSWIVRIVPHRLGVSAIVDEYGVLYRNSLGMDAARMFNEYRTWLSQW